MSDTKTLYLMRHAESACADADQRDIDRPLTPQGERDAITMGKRMKERGISPSVIFSSPACRAEQTATLIAIELGVEPQMIHFKPLIYEASVSDLVSLIQYVEDHLESILLIGHNPALMWVANQLTGNQSSSSPPCSLVTLRTFSPRWEDTCAKTTELLDFDYPAK